jgi:hypothetical protein
VNNVEVETKNKNNYDENEEEVSEEGDSEEAGS